MDIGSRTILLIFWLYVIFTCALLLFSKGFLLKRVVIDNSSDCQPDHWLVRNLWNGVQADIRIQNYNTYDQIDTCSMEVKVKFKKTILIIIDGLRYDFLTYNSSLALGKALPYENKMIKLHELLKEEPSNGRLFKFEADPPTTTMQRIKGLTTGISIQFLSKTR